MKTRPLILAFSVALALVLSTFPCGFLAGAADLAPDALSSGDRLAIGPTILPTGVQVAVGPTILPTGVQVAIGPTILPTGTRAA